jgi:hypothetical protein
MVADPRLHPDGYDVRIRNHGSLSVQDKAPQSASSGILSPSGATNKNDDELKQK